MLSSRGALGAGLASALALLLELPFGAAAANASPDAEATVREAGKHFQQGVVLYGEADYRSALVEFKRAMALSPSAITVYNIAETQFQLHDYAAALRSFDRYLGGAKPDDVHRPEVENNLRLLNARVGRLTVMTVPPGADITVDDEMVGKTPFSDPLIVNVGRVRLFATLPGHAPVARLVDVAAEDNLTVTLELSGAPASGRTTLDLNPTPMVMTATPMVTATPTLARSRPSILRPIGWIVAGAAAAGAITFGVLALREAGKLKDARETYPTTMAQLDDLARRTRTYAITADALAAGAVVIGATMAIWTWSTPSRPSGETRVSRVGVLPGGAVFETTF